MSIELTATQSAQVSGSSQPSVAASAQAQGDVEVLVDQDVPANSTDLPINIGIAATSKLKFLAILNSGGASMSLKIDSGTVTLSLAAGEMLMLAYTDVAKKIADLISGATTLLVIKLTTGAGPDTAHIRLVAIASA